MGKLRVVKRDTKRARKIPGVTYDIVGEKPPVGEGGRFKALTESIRRRGNVDNPEAVAASIGRKKFGDARMQELAMRGRRSSKGRFRPNNRVRRLPRF